MSFDVGDKVVYPHHGAAVIERRERRDAFGADREYLVLKLAYGDLTLMVPADNTDEVGLREVINDEEVEEVFAVLRKKEARMPTNWSRRFKNHVEKLKSGDIYQVAEVVRNLSIREKDKGLSAGEKRMLTKARQILVSELTFALERHRGRGREEARRGAAVDCVTVWAIVVAAGSGTRFGGPKQFEPARGRRVVDWSLAACRSVADGVVLVVPAAARRRDGTADVVVAGGATRSDSVRAGLAAVPADADVIVVHDAARPVRGAGRCSRPWSEAVGAGADGAVPGVPSPTPSSRCGGRVVGDARPRRPRRRADARRPSGPPSCAGPTRPAAKPPTTPPWWRRQAVGSVVVPGDAIANIEDHRDNSIARAHAGPWRPAATSVSASASTSTPSPTIPSVGSCWAASTCRGSAGLAGPQRRRRGRPRRRRRPPRRAGQGDLGQHFPDTDPAWAGADSLGILAGSWTSSPTPAGRPATSTARSCSRRPSWPRTAPQMAAA